MRLSEQRPPADPGSVVATGVRPSAADEAQGWAQQTRRVLTRDLLVRARHAAPGEARSLQFRALHLNLPLVGEVADALGLTAQERDTVEHAALDGLFEAVRLFDPWDLDDFATFAAPFVRAQMLITLPGRRPRPSARPLPRRTRPGQPARAQRPTQGHVVLLAVRRAAQVLAGYHA